MPEQTEMLTEEQKGPVVEAAPARVRRKNPLRLLAVAEDGTLSYAPAQPPDDMTTVAEAKSWMGAGRIPAGRYRLIREIETIVVKAVEKTDYLVSSED